MSPKSPPLAEQTICLSHQAEFPWLPEIPGQCLFPKFLPPQSLCRRLHSSVIISWEPLFIYWKSQTLAWANGVSWEAHHPHSPVETICSYVGDGRVASGGKKREKPFCSIQAGSMVSIHCFLWLRIGHVTQMCQQAELELLVWGLSLCSVLADKKYLLGMYCNNKASSAYIWVTLYKPGSHGL